jgi:hypothetical protein
MNMDVKRRNKRYETTFTATTQLAKDIMVEFFDNAEVVIAVQKELADELEQNLKDRGLEIET